MASAKHGSTLIHFGDFCLDPANFELRKHGLRVRLPQQSARVLTLLTGRAGEVVTRDDVRRVLWSEDTFVDFDHGLNNCIKQIRAALNDDPTDPQYVETVPRRGYRFIARVESAETEIPLAPAGTNGNSDRTGATLVEIPLESAAVSLTPGPHADRQLQGWGLGGGKKFLASTGLAAAMVLGWWFLRPTPAPHLIALHQLTHYGRAEFSSWMVTDGVRLYFTQRVGGKWEIAQVSVAGGEPARVPTPFTNSTLFDISPDSSHLLLGSFEGDEKLLPLWELPILGGAPRRLGNLHAQSAAWSPDGRSLIYGSGSDVDLANADGSDPRKIATIDGKADFFRWSPDGRVVRFMRWDSRDVAVTLWEIRPDGSHLRTITPEGNSAAPGWLDGECSGGWTPDGRYYLYRSNRGNGTVIDAIRERADFFGALRRSPIRLYLSYGDGFCGVLPGRDGKNAYFVGMRELRQLVRYDGKLQQYDPYLGGVPARWIDVSRDGQKIAYISIPDASVWRGSVNGGERKQLTFPPLITGHPKWSPDGKEIVFEGVRPGEQQSVYLISAEGGQPEELTKGDYGDEAPLWSPSGDAIIFERFRAGVGRVGTFSVDIRTHQITKLDVPEHLAFMRWSPDGRYAYASGDSVRATAPLERTALYLFDRSTKTWKEAADAAFLNIVGWTPDSKYIYYQDMYGGETQPVFRVHVPDGKIERLTSPDLALPADVSAYTLIGIGPDGAPLACAIRKNSDIYSVTLDLP